MKLLFLVLLILYNSVLIRSLEAQTGYDRMAPYAWESDAFRAMRLGEDTAEAPEIDFEELAARMIEEEFNLVNKKLSPVSLRFPVKRQKEFERLADTYRIIFKDLVCFPVPESLNLKTPDITYEDGWMERRTFGGERGHEGCDLMGDTKAAGFYPVVSMTDGVVEKAGWLTKGGWRIGIRAPSGAYFYYAHLSGYAGSWEEGEAVRAGELLGYMGDSGYGTEGTTGQFPVHLHLGIYIKTEHYEELSVNPYWILRHMEQYRTRAFY